MKICKVEFRNIRSLTYKGSIDFEDDQIQKEGLFLICGETGVGKTTIFDAITLALYKKVPSGEKEEELVSYGKREAEAAVEFECKGLRYRSHWTYLISKNLLGKEKKSYDLYVQENEDWVLLVSGKKEHTEKVKQITGLTFDEFTRSVLLAQGQFAQFLHAKSKERGELLDSIAGTAYYRELSRKTFETTKKESEKLTYLQSRFDNIEVWDEDTLAVSQKELKQSEAFYASGKIRIKQMEEQKRWLDQFEANQSKISTNTHLINELQPKRQDALHKYQLVEKHMSLAPLLAYTVQLDKAQKRLAGLQQLVEVLENEMPPLAAKIEADTKTLEIQEQKTVEEKEAKKKHDALFQQVIQLDTKIENAQSSRQQSEKLLENRKQRLAQANGAIKTLYAEKSAKNEALAILKSKVDKLTPKKELFENVGVYKEKANQLTLLSDQIKTYAETIEKNKKDRLESNKAIRVLNERISKGTQYANELKSNFEDDDLHALLQNTEDKLAGHQKHFIHLDKAFQLKTELEDKEIKIKDIQLEYNKNVTKKNELGLQQQQLSEKQALLTKVVSYTQVIKELKSSLVAGAACQVCGATEHPNPAFDDEESDRKKLAELEKKVLSVESAIKALNTAVLQDKGALSMLEEAFRQTQKKFDALNISAEQNTKSLENQKNACQQEITTLLSRVEKIKKTLANLIKCDKKLQELQSEKHALEVQHVSLQNQYDTLLQNISTSETSIADSQKWFEEAFQPWGLSVESIEQTISGIEKEKESLLDLVTSKEECFLEVRDIESNIKQKEIEADALKQAIEELTEQVKSQTSRLDSFIAERKQLFGDKSVQDEQAKAIKRLENEENAEKDLRNSLAKNTSLHLQKQGDLKRAHKDVQYCNTEIQENEHFLHHKLELLAFDIKIEDIAAHILPEEEVQKLTQSKNTLEERWQQLQFEKNNLEKQKIELEESKPSGVFEKLEERLKDEINRNSTLEKDIQSLKIQIAENKSKAESKEKLRQEMLVQQGVFSRWHALNDLIGSATGHKFQQFAQNLTMRQLCFLANKHLEIIAPRYRIYTEENNKNIREFWIIDKFQADNKRSVNTLSGGETFLVSLALALGMSDMAGTQTKIQSLFIDEGFGTLDSQTLDLVMDALDNLQTSGKTIGIISHVKELKERIRTQIQVFRKGRGRSRIEMIH